MFEPISQEMKFAQGRVICVEADGFSKSGKSYTIENLLLKVSANLFSGSSVNTDITFEAFQSSGTDVNSFEFPHNKDTPSVDKIENKFLRKLNSIIPPSRLCYKVTTLEAF